MRPSAKRDPTRTEKGSIRAATGIASKKRIAATELASTPRLITSSENSSTFVVSTISVSPISANAIGRRISCAR
jgi:hypothetical protein